MAINKLKPSGLIRFMDETWITYAMKPWIKDKKRTIKLQVQLTGKNYCIVKGKELLHQSDDKYQIIELYNNI